ncbi:MAG: CBS domain-containing protein [Bdellovibrionota bacterium]
MKIAKDIMTKSPFSLKSSMLVPTAVQMMMSHHISSAPILDSNDQLLGQISEIEILKCYIQVSRKGYEKKVLYDFKGFFSKASTVDINDTIAVVVKGVLESPSHRILVLENKKLVGIISPKDILKFLVGDDTKSGSMVQELNILQDRIEILKDQLKATKSELSNIGGIVEKSPFMFHSVNTNAEIVIANEKLHSELGYQPKELIGKSIYDLYDPREKMAVTASLRELMSSNKNIKAYTTYLRKNGEPLRVEVMSTAIMNSKNEFVATSSISRILDSDSLLRALHGIYEPEEED